MSLKGMIKDEGFINTLNIIKNGHKKENREMFKNMHTFFTKTGKDLKYIAEKCTNAEEFKSEVSKRYKNYSGENYLDMTAGFFSG